MPTITTDDGVRLHYEETGRGTPLIFVHEFGGDLRSWEPQVRYFARSYRCIRYNARGYPPSDVPEDWNRYSQERARDDIRSVLDGLKIERAHVVGLSMGAFATLHFGMQYPQRALSITVAGGAYGSHPAHHMQFQQDSRANAERLQREGMAKFVASYGVGPQRVQLEDKDPRAFAEYLAQFNEHSALGSANTLLGVQCRRPSFYDLVERLQKMTVPTLLMQGDEEEPSLEANLLLKRCIPTAGLAVFPRSGHVITFEAGLAVKGLVTEQTFTRLMAQGRKYIPLAERDLLLLRAELGAVITKGGNAEIPGSLLFRAGGTDSIRGYTSRSIGNETNGATYPTRFLATASAEFQHWLTQQWGAAAFYDVGTATDSWSERKFFEGVGVGARWRSPVGVINADLAYGVQRHQVRPHFSLGIGF